ncbi:LOB domain-containing protein 11 [Sesamum angolense]|uniref:LOB domain-containing protein 11 n=1 Tax=Sesamum angolense TaxID=2727404 RepID=A0AAE1XB83_9LAMI|nr:LOB domain-containing protein 11 [Sesamum angolense]
MTKMIGKLVDRRKNDASRILYWKDDTQQKHNKLCSNARANTILSKKATRPAPMPIYILTLSIMFEMEGSDTTITTVTSPSSSVSPPPPPHPQSHVELPEPQRADAVSSMVYEANARLRDPVYGCAGAICQLQKQVSELQEQLAKARAELVNVQCQNANLMALICVEMAQPNIHQSSLDAFDTSPRSYQSNTNFLDENNTGLVWEQLLWT